MQKLRVRDVMTGGELCVAAGTRLADVAETISRHGVDSVAVVDHEDVVVGTVGRAALQRAEARRRAVRVRLPRLGSRRSRARGQRVCEVMSWPPLTVAAETSALEAAHLLMRHRIAVLPVVDERRRPIGSVTATDLLQAFLRPDAEVCEQVEHEVFEHALGLNLDDSDVRIHVEDGVVTLQGRVERRSVAQDAVRLSGEPEGAARVVDRLTFAIDDTGPRPDEGTEAADEATADER